MIKVIKTFRDATNGHVYHIGDKFPYVGTETDERIEELSSNKNRRGEPLIVEMKTKKRTKKDA